MKVKNHGDNAVALTGGHFSPAYALVEALIAKHTSILFFGRRHAFSEGQSPTIEHEFISSLPYVTFIPTAGMRFNAHLLSLSTITQFFQAIASTIAVGKQLQKHSVSYIISFGGYLAVPVCLAGWLLRIPIYLHEQTIAPGLANRLVAHLATHVYTSFPEAIPFFPKGKTECIGNPYHSEFLSPQKPDWFIPDKRPVLLIMGGSSGSHSINCTIEKALPQLTDQYQIVHQTGASKYHDYERLSLQASAHYYPVVSLLPKEMAYFLSCAKAAISRSGANTFFLLVQYHLPSVLVPLTIAPNDEQRKHALCMKQHGTAELLEERDINKLPQLIQQVISQNNSYRSHFAGMDSYKKLLISGERLLEAIIHET